MGRSHAIHGLSLGFVLKIAKMINQIHLRESFYDLTHYIWRFFDFSECCFRVSGERENQNFLTCSLQPNMVAAGKKSITFKIYAHYISLQTHVCHFIYTFYRARQLLGYGGGDWKKKRELGRDKIFLKRFSPEPQIHSPLP